MLRPVVLAACLVTGLNLPATAQGWIDVERRPNVSLPPSPVLRLSSQVRVQIDGRVARVEVEEQFRNNGGGIAEGTYLYPLPGEAVFTDFSLWMGEEEVRGEVMRAEQARGIYEEIVRRLKDPALLTLEGHGLIRARVFPIQPGETRKVVLRYTQSWIAQGTRFGSAMPLATVIASGSGGAEMSPVSIRINFPSESRCQKLPTWARPTHPRTM